jgi:hypothetical protein
MFAQLLLAMLLLLVVQLVRVVVLGVHLAVHQVVVDLVLPLKHAPMVFVFRQFHNLALVNAQELDKHAIHKLMNVSALMDIHSHPLVLASHFLLALQIGMVTLQRF